MQVNSSERPLAPPAATSDASATQPPDLIGSADPADRSSRPRRSDCPIACTLDLVGDRWTLLVVRDLVLGKRRYNEFLASSEGIPTNILADRLKRLERAGLVEAAPYGSHSRRREYRLTEAGLALRPALLALLTWGQTYVPGTRPPDGFRLPPPTA